MPNWRPEFRPEHLYFITTKAVDYAHLFKRDVMKRLILDALDCFRATGRLKLYGFVIMPNHIHFIGQFPEDHPLADVVRDFKRHTAERLIRQLKAEKNRQALDWLAAKISRPGKQIYKVWEDGYLAKEIFSEDFLAQKMDYMHQNPCQKHWSLSAQPEEYPWSSARFYLTDEACIIPIDDVRIFLVGGGSGNHETD
jgi:REP element-mobilizing transposase RayT